jgi:hypothetical protein
MEFCATADAQYDSAQSKITVRLDAFARHVVAGNDGRQLPQPWLPPAEVVTEHLSPAEATTFARDVFHHWTRKVKSSVPAELHLRS